MSAVRLIQGTGIAFLLSGTLLLAVQTARGGTYTDSAHGNATTGVDRSSVDSRYAGYATGNCGHCHEQHASLQGSEPTDQYGLAGANLSLRFSAEENLCETCHDGSPVARNVKAQLSKPYSHPVEVYSGRHTESVLEIGQNGAPFRNGNRHVECADCHEPHSINAFSAANPNPFPDVIHSYLTGDPASNNKVSGVLYGTWGVEPGSEPLWSPPTAYSELPQASREYQICFKCHSYYALQEADGIASAITGPSGQTATDQAMEFSKGNKSVHPVRSGLAAQTGSYSPRQLTTSQMKAPWNDPARIGVQTMYCSDCHGSDQARSSAVPAGPHGSNNRYLLRDATNNEWPRSSEKNDELWTLMDVKNNRYNWASKLLCAKCHVLFSNGSFKNAVHNKGDHLKDRPFRDEPWRSAFTTGLPCVTCHVTVPHGSKRSRMIVYQSDPEPYKLLDYKHGNTQAAVITAFKKSTSGPNNYNERNCYIPSGTGCSDHNRNDGGYDP